MKTTLETMEPHQNFDVPPPLPPQAGNLDASTRALREKAKPKPKDPRSKWEKLPGLLRFLGGSTLVIAAISFLISGWADYPPILRYYGFLGFTALLTLMGVFCALRWKEDKGARTFLGFSTGFIPILVVQLGGLIYLALQGSQGATMPSWLSAFQFAPQKGPILWLTFSLSGILLPVVTYGGFSVLARKQALRLTGVFALSNALLLLPWRDSGIVFLVASLGTLLVAGLDYFQFHHQPRLKNWEGRFARSMLYIPFAILVGRNLVLFDFHSLQLAYLGAVSTVFSFFIVPQFKCGGKRLLAFQELSILSAGLTWMFLLHGVFGVDFIHLDTPLLVLPLSALMALASTQVEGRGHHWRRVAAGAAIFSVSWQMFFDPSAAASITCILVSLLVTIAAFLMEEKGLLRWGIVGLALGAIYHFRYLILFGADNRWLALAVLGTLIILSGSFLERRGGRLVQTGKQIRSTLENWK